MIKRKFNNDTQLKSDAHSEQDYKPLIDLFELLLEWDMKDVQEKAEKRKEIQ